MRALYISTALLAAMFLLTLANSHYVASQVDSWLDLLEQVDIAADNEDWDTVMSTAQQAYTSWSHCQFYFHTVIRHEELDQAESLFLQLLVVCDEQDAAEARLHLADLRSQLRLLAEMEALSIPNIL